jgi:transcriptional regulator with XRE-family HTH domain
MTTDGNGLRAARIRAGLSQTEAAAALGLSTGGYIKNEHGDRGLKGDFIRRACELYEVSAEEILRGTAARNAPLGLLGGKVKARREHLGLSQAELARAAGVSQPVIAAIESGEQKTARNLPRIAMALQLDIAELDPDYPKMRTLSPENSSVAYEVMLEFLRPDLPAEARKALSRIFLDLAQERLDNKIGGSLADQLRLRIEYMMRPYRQTLA